LKGDWLLSHDGQWTMVEEIVDSREATTVYNLRVSDHHTYFVGSGDWGFSVWVHNAEYEIFEKEGQYFIREKGTTQPLIPPGMKDPVPLTKEQAEAWLARSVAPKGLPPLRQAYISEVEALKDTAAQLRAAGKTPEEIARTLHQMRRDIGIKYKDLTPADKQAEIHVRNLEKYGDKLGPTIDYLRGKGKTWEEIIESASRSGGADLGLAK
jgi:hypothetical protein